MYLKVKSFVFLLPIINTLHNLVMVWQFYGQLGFLYFSIETAITKRQVHLSTITTNTTRNSMLNIKLWICSNEIRYTYLLSGIKTYVMLFFPKNIFQYIFVCRFNNLSSLILEQNYDILSSLIIGALVLFYECSNGISLIGIIQLTCKLNMNLGILIYLSFCKQTVH